MRQKGNPLSLVLLLVGLTWLVLLVTGRVSYLSGVVSKFLPPWTSILALILVPFFAAGVILEIKIDWKFRLFSFVSMIACCSIMPVSISNYPVASIATILMLYFEVYWFIPKINKTLDHSRNL